MKTARLGLILALLAAFSPLAVQAQIISGSSATGVGGDSLSYSTANDPFWAQFGVSGTQTGSGLINVMSGASSVISVSAITEAGDLIPARTQSTSLINFGYTNGTSPSTSTTQITSSDVGTTAAGNVSVQTGYSGDQSDPTSGQSLSFTITFNQAVSSGVLDLVANDYNATSTFTFAFGNSGATAGLNDPTPPYTGQGAENGSNDNAVYTLDFSAVPEGTVLTVTDTMTGTFGGYQNTSISGLAFTALDVPEPSAYAMMLAGVAAVFGVLRLRSRGA